MNKKIILCLIMLLCIHTICFATSEMEEGNMYDYYVDSFDYEENYENFETLSLAGKVLKASEPFMYDNGYMQNLAQRVKVEITDSRHNGDVYEIIYSLQDDYNTNLPLYAELKENDRVYVYANFENDELLGEAAIQYYDKTNWMLLVAGIFAMAILLIGGKKGLKALIGLAITIAGIFTVLIPGIFDGKDPVVLSVIVCSITTFLTFIIVSGFSKKTFAAICGTIAGVVAAAFFGFVFSELMQLNGINEDARQLSVCVEEGKEMFDFEGIMLAGIMISALGACMDIGMSIASSIEELKKENPDMTATKLIKSGMNIGRDVMGTMTNTLILAYVGSSMLCMLLFTINEFPLHEVLNREDVSMDVLNSLVGSIGLVCTIPLTALISGLIMGGDLEKAKKTSSKNDDVKVRYFNG